jgi:small conductance mechanosensitive channel
MEFFSPEILSKEFFNAKGISFLTSFATQILAGIITIIIGFWIAGRASRVVTESLGRIKRIDKTVLPMIGALVRYAGMTLTMVVALGKFGVETTSIIAVLGAAGLAIGLALQGTLSNVAAGLMLVFLRPFKIGDWVEVAGVSGSVREISLFTTTIDTFDNIYISVPNSAIWSSNIINHARYGRRRLDVDIGIAYESSLDDAETALMELAKDPRVLKNPAPRFLVISYDDSAILVRLRVHAEYTDFFDLGYDLNRRLKGTMEAHNISIPYPQRVIRQADDAANDKISD